MKILLRLIASLLFLFAGMSAKADEGITGSGVIGYGATRSAAIHDAQKQVKKLCELEGYPKGGITSQTPFEGNTTDGFEVTVTYWCHK